MGLRAIRAMRLTANELKDQLAGVSEKTQQINRSTLEVADKTDSKAASRSAEQNASKKEMLARDLQVARIKQTVGAIQTVAGAVGTVASSYKADLTQKMEDLDKEIEADLLDKLADQLGIERTAGNLAALKGLSNDDLNRLANGSSEDMAEVLKGVDLGPESVQVEGGSFLDFLEELLTGSSDGSTTKKPKSSDDLDAADDGTDEMMPEVVILPPEQRPEKEASPPEQTLTTPPPEAPAKKVDVASPDDASKGKATPAVGSATHQDHQDHQDRVKAVRSVAEQLLQARQAAGFQKTWISETLKHAQRFGPGNGSLLGEGGLLTKGLLKATVFKLGDPTLVAKYLNENFAGPARGQHQERRQERVDLEKQRDKQRHDQVTAISNLEQVTAVTFTDEERTVLNKGGQAARELLLTKGTLQLDGDGKLAKGPALDAFMALEKANGKIDQLDRRIERAKVKEAAAWSNLAKELADIEHFLDLADDKAAKGGGSQKINDMRREMRASLDQDLARLERDQQDLLGAGSAEQGVTERDAKRQAKIADDLASGWRTLFNRRQETAKEVDDGRLRSEIETRTLEAGENALSLQAFAVDAKDRADSWDPLFLAGVGGDRGVRQLADRVEKEANRQLAQPIQNLDKGKGREALQQTMDEALKGNVMAQVQWRTLAFGDKAAVEAVVGKKLNDQQFAQVQAAARETLGRVATGSARDVGALLNREVSATELTGFQETAKQIEDRHFEAKVTALAESVEAVEAFVDNETTLGQTNLTKVIAAATQGDAKALDKWRQLAFGDKAAVEKVVGRSLTDDQVAEVQRTARNALQLVAFGNQADVKRFLGKDAENLKAVRQMAQKGYAARPELAGNAGPAQWQRSGGREASRQADALDRVKTIREAVQRDKDHHWQIGASFQNSDGVTLAEAKDYLTMIQREMIRYNGRVAAVGQKADNKEMLTHLHNLRRMALDQNLGADARTAIERAIANVEARRFLDTRGLTKAIDPQALKSFETQLLVATKSRKEVESHLHETGRLTDDQQLSQGDYESLQKQARAELGLEQASSQMIQAFQSREEVQKHLREIGDLKSDQVLSQADYARRQEQALAALTRLAKQNWDEQALLSMAAGGRTAMDEALGKPLTGSEYNELEAHLKRILANRFLDRTEHLQLIQLAYGTNVASEAGETLNTTDLGKGRDLARRLLNQETVDEGLLEAIVDGNQAEVGKQLGLGAKATEVLLRIVRPEAERAKTEMDRLSSGDIAAKLYGLFGATPQLAKRQIDKGLEQFAKLDLAQQNALLNQLAQTRRGQGTAQDYMLSLMNTEQLTKLRSIDRFAANLATKLDLGTAMGIDRALAARHPRQAPAVPQPDVPQPDASQPPTAFQQAVTAHLGITDKEALASYTEMANLLIEGKQAEAGAKLAELLEMNLSADQKAALLANLASGPLLRDAQGKSGLQRMLQTASREALTRVLQTMARDDVKLDLAAAQQVADEMQRRGVTSADLRDWAENQLTQALIRQSVAQPPVALVTDEAKVDLLYASLSGMIDNGDLGHRARGRYAVELLAGTDPATQAAVLNRLAQAGKLQAALDQLKGADREQLLKLAAANHGLSKKAAELLKAGAGDKASIHLRSQLQQRIDQGTEAGKVQVKQADEVAVSRGKVQALAREIIRRSQWDQLDDLKDLQGQIDALTAEELAEVLDGLASVSADAQTAVLGKWLAKLEAPALEAMVDKLAGSDITLSAKTATLLGHAYGQKVGREGREANQDALVGLMGKALAATPVTDTPVDDQKVSSAVDVIKAQLANDAKATDIEQALRLLSPAERAAVFNALADAQDADGNDLLSQLLGQDDDRMRDRFVLLLADTRGLSEKATAVLETNAKPVRPDDLLLKAKVQARRLELTEPQAPAPTNDAEAWFAELSQENKQMAAIKFFEDHVGQFTDITAVADREAAIKGNVRRQLERRGIRDGDVLDRLTDQIATSIIEKLDAEEASGDNQYRQYIRLATEVIAKDVAVEVAGTIGDAADRSEAIYERLASYGFSEDDARKGAAEIVAQLAETGATDEALEAQYQLLFAATVTAFERGRLDKARELFTGLGGRRGGPRADRPQEWQAPGLTKGATAADRGEAGQRPGLAKGATASDRGEAGQRQVKASTGTDEPVQPAPAELGQGGPVSATGAVDHLEGQGDDVLDAYVEQLDIQEAAYVTIEADQDDDARRLGVKLDGLRELGRTAGRNQMAALWQSFLSSMFKSAFSALKPSLATDPGAAAPSEEDYEKLRAELVELIESERERIEEANDKAYLAMVTAQMEESAVVLLEARGLLAMAAQSGDDAKLQEARGVMQLAMTHYQNARITFESALAPGGGTDEEGGEARDAVLAKLDTSLIKQADALLISGQDMVQAADRLLSGDASGRVADQMLLTGGKTPESIVKAMSVGDVVRQRLRKWEEIANKTSHTAGASGETGVVVDADDHQVGWGDVADEGGDGQTDDDRRAELARQIRHAERQLSEGVAQDQAEALQVLQDALVAETIDGETFTNRLTEQDMATVLTVLGQGGTLDRRLLGRLQVALSEMRVKLGGSKADGTPPAAATEPAGTAKGSESTDLATDDHGGVPSGQVGSTSGPSEGIVNVESPAVTTAVGRSAAEQPHAGAGSTRLASVAQADGAIKDRQSVRATYDKAAEAYLVAADQLETLRADYLGKLQTMLEARQALTEAHASGRGVAVAEAAFRQASAAVETARTATLAQAGQLAELADRLSAVRATLAGETDVSGQVKVQSREQITSLVQGAERDLVRFAADGAQSPLSVQELLLGQQLIMEGELALLQRERAADGRFAQLASDLDARRTANRQQAERLANVIQLEQQMAPAAGLAERRGELQQAYAEINGAIDRDRQALHGINAHISARTAEQDKLAERQAQWRTLSGLLEMAERAPAQADRARLTQAYEALAATVAADGSQAEQQALAAARPHLQRLLGSPDQASEADRDGLIQRQNLPAVKSAAAEVLTAFRGQDTDRQSAVIKADIAAKTADGERLNGQIAARQATRSDVWQQLQQVNRQAAAQPTEQGTLDADLALVTDLTTVPSAYGHADFEGDDQADREAVLTATIDQNQQRLLTVEQANLQATGSRQDRLASARTIDGVRRDIAAQRNEGEQREHQYARRNAINEAVDQVWVAKENLRLATNAGADPATLARLQAQVDDANRQLKEVRYGQRELGTSSDRERQWQAGQKRADGIAGFMATAVSSTLGGFRTLLSGSEYGFQRHLMNIVEGLEKINQARAEYRALLEALALAMKEEKRLAAEMMLLGIEQEDATAGHGK